MKIIVIASRFNNYAGGGEICLQTLVQLLVKDSHNCTVISKTTDNPTTTTNKNSEYNLISTSEAEYLNVTLNQILLTKPDVIICQDEWGKNVLKKTRNIIIPKLYFIRYINMVKNNRDELELLRYYYIDSIIVNSKFLQRQLLKTTNKKSVLSLPLVDQKKYKSKNNTHKYITMINYRKSKGKHIFDAIAKKFPKQEFLAIRGWLPNNKKIGTTKINNLTISGPHKNMTKVYSQTKLLLIPSIIPETLPRVALEAAANGIPIVASDIGGMKEAVNSGGILIKNFQKIDKWNKAINNFSNNKFYKKMGLQAYQRSNKYNLDNEYQVILSELNKHLQKRNSTLSMFLIRGKYLYLRVVRFLMLRLIALLKNILIQLRTTIDSIFNIRSIVQRKLWEFLFLKSIAPQAVASNNFGYDRGDPIDRYYIENKFLEKYKKFIRGNVLEVGDNLYTRKYGKHHVTKSDVLNVNEENQNSTIIDNLTECRFLKKNYYDCFISTQVYLCIYDIKTALKNSIKILKNNGVLLLTVPGITPISTFDYNNWGQYWSFTDLSLKKMLSELLPESNYKIETFGNVQTAAAFMYGYSWKEMSPQLLDHQDKRFQVVITGIISKGTPISKLIQK